MFQLYYFTKLYKKNRILYFKNGKLFNSYKKKIICLLYKLHKFEFNIPN